MSSQEKILSNLKALRDDLERIDGASGGKYSSAIEVLKEAESEVGKIVSSESLTQEKANTYSVGMGLGSSGAGNDSDDDR